MNNYGKLITELKNICDEINDMDTYITVDDKEKAFDMCDVTEHITLAWHHLHTAVNKLIIINCFEKGDKE